MLHRLCPVASAVRHYSSATKRVILNTLSWEMFDLSRCLTGAYGRLCLLLLQMTVRDALNSALSEEMAADSSVFFMGEEVIIIVYVVVA